MNAISMFISSMVAGIIGYIVGRAVCFVIARVIDTIKRDDRQKIEDTLEQIDNAITEIIEKIEKAK